MKNVNTDDDNSRCDIVILLFIELVMQNKLEVRNNWEMKNNSK